jgi:hypothetical protein
LFETPFALMRSFVPLSLCENIEEIQKVCART